MPDGPGLVIPLRLDSDPAHRSLNQLGQSMDKAGAAGKRAGADIGKGMEEAKASTGGLNDEMAGLLKTQAGLSGIRQLAGMINEQMRAAATYTAQTAAGFVKVQQGMQGIAALMGKTNSNQLTVEEARKGAAANLTPADWTKFRDAFLSKASNYVGNGPNAKLTQDEGDKFQASMAEYAKLHGVGMEEMADFSGGLLAQQKGPTNAKDMTAQAGKVFSTLEASSAKVGHLLPGMTRVMAQGFSASEAAPTLAMMPEIAPEEESTHLLRVIAEVRRLNLEGKGGDYGMQKGMSPQQQLEALVGNLSERSGQGEDLDKLIQGVTHEDIAGNTLRGLVRQGPKGFKQWKDILANTADNAVDVDIAKGRETDPGKQMAVDAKFDLAEVERGALHAGRERLKKEAEGQLISEGRFDEGRYEDAVFRKVMVAVKGTGVREQLINERATDIAQDRAGIAKNQQYPLPIGASQHTADTMIEKLLEKQQRELERQTKLAEDAAAARAGRPLVARPPNPSNRMGG